MNFAKVTAAITNHPYLPLGYLDFFASLWLCSHVRFRRGLWDADDYNREHALAWALQPDARGYKTGWIDSVAQATCCPVSAEEIASRIETLQTEIQESDDLANPTQLPFERSELLDAKNLLRIQGLALYHYGPIAVYTWQRRAEFNYLEIHYES